MEYSVAAAERRFHMELLRSSSVDLSMYRILRCTFVFRARKKEQACLSSFGFVNSSFHLKDRLQQNDYFVCVFEDSMQKLVWGGRGT